MDSGRRTAAAPRAALRFDRNELAGAFGDIGTDLPLIVGMVLVAKLDAASVLILYGAMQVLTGFWYRLPMAVQPLKAVAVLVIGQKLSGNIIYGGGLAIGVTMLLLTVTGLVDWLGRVVPKAVVRGIQFGLGLQLASLVFKNYLPADGNRGYVLAALAFTLAVFLLGNRRLPPALLILLLGLVYALAFKVEVRTLVNSLGFRLPQPHWPAWHDVVQGFLLLALPQVPLSIGNSILAARQTIADLFPERVVSLRKISYTYSAMNLINPFLSGIPTCHGSGGLAGHYAFGARTGGSVIIYGLLYLVLGGLLSSGFAQVIEVFPKPVLGVILLFESLTLMLLTRDLAGDRRQFFLVVLVGLMAMGLPDGYVVALVVGTLLSYSLPKARSQGQ